MRFDVLVSVACQPTWGQQFYSAAAVMLRLQKLGGWCM